ncbi:hypothetical protein TWF730_002870 [Orbilia blumenaviensis]|uniref:Uncharacterized protein n=1 Tax=Orbilia blumenaviensis TaxID=1796055 RepID=A0AAV9U819_9PEZI
MMLSIAARILILFFPPLALAYYIGFAQRGINPQVLHINRGVWFDCYKLPTNKETLLGLSIYNARSQTYFPDGLQFYTDHQARCTGEPALVLTFSKRPGVYWVNLEALGLSRVLTCWKYYDLQENPLKLAPSNLRSVRKGYAKGSRQDLAFRTNNRSHQWMEAKKLVDVPFSSTIGLQYSLEYLAEYGMPPEGPTQKERDEVIAYMENRLRTWSNPLESRNYVKLRQQPLSDSILQEEVKDNPIPGEIAATIEGDQQTSNKNQRQNQYQPKSLDHMRYLAQLPKKPVEMQPKTQRMLEILRQNVLGKIEIPLPQTSFELRSLKSDLSVPQLVEEVARLTLDRDSDDVQLGWTLARLATLRDMAPRQEGVSGAGPERKSALIDISDLSEVDASSELKLHPDIELPPLSIARNLGPEGVAPPHQDLQRGAPIQVDSNEEVIEPYGRQRRPPLPRVAPMVGPLRGPDLGSIINRLHGNAKGGKNVRKEKTVIEIVDDSDDDVGVGVGVEDEGVGVAGQLLMGDTALDEVGALEGEAEGQRIWEEALRDAGLEDMQETGDLSSPQLLSFTNRARNLMTAQQTDMNEVGSDKNFYFEDIEQEW